MVSTGSAAAVCSRKLGWDRQGDIEENISETVKTNQTVNHVCSHFQTRPRCIALKSIENKCTHYYNIKTINHLTTTLLRVIIDTHWI